MIKLLIFDVGGTLTDFHKILIKTDQEVLKKLYGIKTSKKEIEKIVNKTDIILNVNPKSYFRSGKFLEKYLLKHFNLSEKEYDRFDKQWFKSVKWNEIKTFRDVVPSLRKLQNKYFLATLANTPDQDLHNKIMNKNKLKKHFHLHINSEEIGIRKPDPRIFKIVLDHFKVKPKETVMIGDTPIADIFGAKGVGIHSILINRRKLPYKLTSEAKPDFKIKSFRELPKILRKLED